MSAETGICARCGQPAKGFATIDEDRYCHEGPGVTCYMAESQERATASIEELVAETPALVAMLREVRAKAEGRS